MKKCNNCGTQTEDQAMFCPNCGSSELSTVTVFNGQPMDGNGQPYGVNGQSYDANGQPQYEPVSEIPDNGNIAMGVVGAVLFSLAGVALYFILYQLDIIAAISGIVMFILAQYGYNVLAKPSSKSTKIGLVVAAVVALVMIFVAEYVSVTYVFYDTFNESGVSVTFLEMLKAMPDFLSDPEVKDAVVSDLVFAYIASGVGIVVNLVSAKKAKK